MKVLVVGSGGREHAIAKKINQSPLVDALYCAPGNDAMKSFATCVDDHNIVQFAQNESIDWVIIGPEAPLAEGLADQLTDAGVKVFGPNQKAAQMESSKDFAKQLMEKYDIPTAKHITVDSLDSALTRVEEFTTPVVIKEDGLKAGKGVVISETMEHAQKTLEEIYVADEKAVVVLEQFLEGEEYSLMVMVNDETFKAFDIIAQDHKRAHDGDQGPNTGGMGAYAPVNHLPKEVIDDTITKIVKPTVDGMSQEGLNFFGILYVGLIWTTEGPKVIEYNVRLGDPEAQVLLESMTSDFMQHIIDLHDGREVSMSFNDQYTLGVMMASVGYPGSYDKDVLVKGYEGQDHILISGLKQDGNDWKTNGGRVLLVLGQGDSLKAAKDQAYERVNEIESDGLFYRKDIGDKGI